MAIPHGVLKFALAGFTPAPALAVDKQSIKFDEGANTNLHELHCCKVGGWVTQCMGFENTLLLQAFVEILHLNLETVFFSNTKSWIGLTKMPGFFGRKCVKHLVVYQREERRDPNKTLDPSKGKGGPPTGPLVFPTILTSGKLDGCI